jgi:hypothetical protein
MFEKNEWWYVIEEYNERIFPMQWIADSIGFEIQQVYL